MITCGYNWSSATAGVDELKWVYVSHYCGSLGYTITWKARTNS